MQDSITTEEQTTIAKQSIVETLEQGRVLVPQVIRLVTAILQESLAEIVGPLLMIGLILSMSNFLLGGAIFRFWGGIAFIWVLCQSVAVDANMGVMLLRSVRNFHAGEIVKGIIFLLIALALLFVAAIISDVEAVQEIINKSLDAIFGQIYISVEVLTFIRSSAIVALVAATPLESVSLRRAKKAAKIEVIKEEPEQPTPPEEPQTGPIVNVFEQMTMINTLQELIDEVKLLRSGSPCPPAMGTTQEHEIVKIEEMKQDKAGIVEINEDQARRLQVAYEELSTQGPVSANRLRQKAGVKSIVATAWLTQKTEQAEEKTA